jgi:hypothetical protein
LPGFRSFCEEISPFQECKPFVFSALVGKQWISFILNNLVGCKKRGPLFSTSVVSNK